ncbi:uncharacterized protein JCM10292_007068 [Rhodotorula paludigena]|uniref:uncharacterized protein n=1 Tax=Rhodotorula paludigena TaxID=86838 RepID=UPI00317C63B4
MLSAQSTAPIHVLFTASGSYTIGLTALINSTISNASSATRRRLLFHLVAQTHADVESVLETVHTNLKSAELRTAGYALDDLQDPRLDDVKVWAEYRSASLSEWSNQLVMEKEALEGFEHDTCTLNNGVLVYDLKAWREHKPSYTDQLFEWTHHNAVDQLYSLGSQPPFNLVFYRNYKILDNHWNLMDIAGLHEETAHGNGLPSTKLHEQVHNAAILHWKTKYFPIFADHVREAQQDQNCRELIVTNLDIPSHVEKFTVIIVSFARADTLVRIARHLEHSDYVKEVIVAWNNQQIGKLFFVHRLYMQSYFSHPKLVALSNDAPCEDLAMSFLVAGLPSSSSPHPTLPHTVGHAKMAKPPLLFQSNITEIHSETYAGLSQGIDTVAWREKRHSCLENLLDIFDGHRPPPQRYFYTRDEPTVLLLTLVLLCCYTLSRFLGRAAPVRATIVLTAFETSGLRPEWLRTICERYVSREYAQIVEEVLLVWNNPEAEPPAELPEEVKVVRTEVNSLNNRWLAASTAASPVVLAHDNDLVLSKNGIRCMLNVWRDHPDRLIGPYARARDGFDYVLDDLVSRPSAYHFVLPRALAGSTSSMAQYGVEELTPLRQYVDSQAAHCDDLLLNLAVADSAQTPPLRVALPPGSVSDYASVCSPLDRTQSSGLADQGSRWALRTECLHHFLTSAHFTPEASSPGTRNVAVCDESGESYTLESAVSLRRWRAMDNGTAADLCPELAALHLAHPAKKQAPASYRPGVGGEIAEYCPEVDQARVDWVDALVALPTCAVASGGGGLRMGERLEGPLVESAKHQCGAWCIWDLRTSRKAGWHLRQDECFERFEHGHPACDEWFWQRPRFDL